LYNSLNTDRQGRTFADVKNDQRINFAAVLGFFDDPDRQRRMVESEVHHDRPALAGVIKELEQQPDIRDFLEKEDAHTTVRFRQAVGVIVRIVMENQGWRTTGKKGLLAHGWPVTPRTTTGGAYRNVGGGLSKSFTRTERYEKI